MKKAIVLLMLAAGLLSCAKENLTPAGDNTDPTVVPMRFDITVAQTKAAKTAWAEGDVIYVFFKGLENKYVKLVRGSDSWTETSGADDLVKEDFNGLTDKTLTAVHFPVAVDVSYAAGQFSFTNGGAPVYNYYLFESGKSYSVDNTTVTATLSLGKPSGLALIHIAGIESNVADYTFGCSRIRPVACTGVGVDGSIKEREQQDGARLRGVADADGGVFAGRLVSPGTATNYKFTLASDEKIYTLTRTDKTLTAGMMYNFPSPSQTGDPNWSVTEASDLYVNLGLSVKWAKCNLGASDETDDGDYFSWGELQPEPGGVHNWGNYIFGEYGALKYNEYEQLVLEKEEDDAAYAALGGKFRMPTWLEVLELGRTKGKENYTWSWSDGWTITYTVTGARIHLPATGYCDDMGFNEGQGSGFYWSSTLDGYDHPQMAWSMHFVKNGGLSMGSAFERYWGLAIRPVSTAE